MRRALLPVCALGLAAGVATGARGWSPWLAAVLYAVPALAILVPVALRERRRR